jgi:hypothetical protein
MFLTPGGILYPLFAEDRARNGAHARTPATAVMEETVAVHLERLSRSRQGRRGRRTVSTIRIEAIRATAVPAMRYQAGAIALRLTSPSQVTTNGVVPPNTATAVA